MNKKFVLSLAYILKYVKCFIIMLITVGVTLIVLENAVYQVIVPVLLFELFAYSGACFVMKYLSRKKNPNFLRIWGKHEELLDELNKSNRYEEFNDMGTLLSKSNSFKNTYDLYKVAYTGSDILNADQFKEIFDNGELTNYVINNTSIQPKYKNQIIRLYKDSGINKASFTIMDEAKNGKNSIYQKLVFSYTVYIIVSILALIGSIITVVLFGQGYFGNIAMICGAALLVIMILVYFEFKNKFETFLQSVVVMNNMIQYFFDKKEEIPQFTRNTDALIAFYQRNK